MRFGFTQNVCGSPQLQLHASTTRLTTTTTATTQRIAQNNIRRRLWLWQQRPRASEFTQTALAALRTYKISRRRTQRHMFAPSIAKCICVCVCRKVTRVAVAAQRQARHQRQYRVCVGSRSGPVDLPNSLLVIPASQRVNASAPLDTQGQLASQPVRQPGSGALRPSSGNASGRNQPQKQIQQRQQQLATAAIAATRAATRAVSQLARQLKQQPTTKSHQAGKQPTNQPSRQAASQAGSKSASQLVGQSAVSHRIFAHSANATQHMQKVTRLQRTRRDTQRLRTDRICGNSTKQLTN